MEKEKYSDIYTKARQLKRETSILKQRCGRLWLYEILYAITLLTLLLIVMHIAHYLELSKVVYADITFSLIAVVAIKYILRYISKYKNTTRSLCAKCEETSGQLSDMIDWGSMRKRQLYQDTDPYLESVLNDFFLFCISKKCPFHGGRKQFRALHLLLTMMTLYVPFLMIVHILYSSLSK